MLNLVPGVLVSCFIWTGYVCFHIWCIGFLFSFRQVRFVYMLGVLAHCFIWAGEVCFRTFVNVACLCCVFLVLGFFALRNLPSRLYPLNCFALW